jgi:hypothetical protein
MGHAIFITQAQTHKTSPTPNEAQSRVKGAATHFGYTGTLTVDLSRQNVSL